MGKMVNLLGCSPYLAVIESDRTSEDRCRNVAQSDRDLQPPLSRDRMYIGNGACRHRSASQRINGVDIPKGW